jgi:hypothetical protein
LQKAIQFFLSISIEAKKLSFKSNFLILLGYHTKTIYRKVQMKLKYKVLWLMERAQQSLLAQKKTGKIAADFIVFGDIAFEIDVVLGLFQHLEHRGIGRLAIREQSDFIPLRQRPFGHRFDHDGGAANLVTPRAERTYQPLDLTKNRVSPMWLKPA